MDFVTIGATVFFLIFLWASLSFWKAWYDSVSIYEPISAMLLTAICLLFFIIAFGVPCRGVF